MELTAKHFGKTVLYGIVAAFMAALIVSVFQSGGVLYEAVENFMSSICG